MSREKVISMIELRCLMLLEKTDMSDFITDKVTDILLNLNNQEDLSVSEKIITKLEIEWLEKNK